MNRSPDKRAWIIGASEGMARELARLMAADGWDLVISARQANRLQTLADELKATALAVDATDAEGLHAVCQRVFACGPVHTIVMNVGAYEPMPVAHFNRSLFEQLNRSNYLSAVYLLDSLLPLLQEQNDACEIIFNASAAAYCGLPGAAPYSAPKAALLHMLEALQAEMQPLNIRLRVINPGFVESRLTAKNTFWMPGLMSPQQAAQRIFQQMPGRHFEISFPRRLIWSLKLLRCLPYRLRFWLTQHMVPAP